MSTLSEETTTTADRRITTRAEVAIAARVIAPLWPATSVIAVNPLLGLQDRSFEDAVGLARNQMGANGFRSLASFRADHEAGFIADHHLREALLETIGDVSDLMPIPTPAGEINALELLVADLLVGSEQLPTDMLQSAAARCDSMIGGSLAGSIDQVLSRWLAAYADRHGSAWSMPGARFGFHEAFRSVAQHDSQILRLAGSGALLAKDPEDSINQALDSLGVTGAGRTDEMRAQLLRLPGWAGWIKWRTEWAGDDCTDVAIDLVDLLAVRISLEAAAVAQAVSTATPDAATTDVAPPTHWQIKGSGGPAERLNLALGQLEIDQSILSADSRARALATLTRIGDVDRLSVWLRAQEASFRDRLLSDLSRSQKANSLSARPTAQAVFCIDVRSEGMRRHLESVGDCATFGFAGFFAVAVKFRELGAQSGTPLYPVLLSAAAEVAEVPIEGAEPHTERLLESRARASALAHAFHASKSGMASPFALAEAGGIVAGPTSALRTLSTRFADRMATLRQVPPKAATQLNITAADTTPGGFTDDDQVLYAHAALTMMGLTKGFARVVAFCGHGSDTVNNPYASSLDCGACGGNQGGPNARILAAILNREEIRSRLAPLGIVIPEDTVFVGAQHDTTADTVSVLDRHLVPSSHLPDLDQFEAECAEAGALLTVERAKRLPGADQHAGRYGLASRGTDWAQVRPEWGLAGNAAFIVGDRSLTEGIDLGCRAFLHSYRAECDPDSSALETILTAPLVVAQWINSQYYFSSVDPNLYGAGDKTLHNVTGNGAIVLGSGGDLKVGLPWQSVGVGDELVHEPLRLLAVVEAPIERIERLIAAHSVLQELFAGGWVSLVARNDSGSEWHQRSRGGTWSSWRPLSGANDQQHKEESAR